jgi:DNA-binding transcriptional LysR family regulator
MEEPAAVHETDQLLKPRDSWLGIEIRHFAALAAIASERSFRGAAERLGYVQSAISRQIAYLEQATGSRLIERSQGPKPVHLTEAGELLLAHATAILGTLDAAQDDLAKVETAHVDEVRVGFFPGVATRILPAALVAFGRRRPDVRVVARESGTDKPLYDLLRRGSIDIAFAHLPAEDGPFDSCELLEVAWALVVPAGTELAERDAPPTLDEIARLPLIASSSDATPWSDSPRGPRVPEPHIVARFDGAQIVQALAGAGVGAAIVPRLAVHEDPRTAVIELDHLLPPARLGLVWLRLRELEPSAQEFRQVARNVGLALAQRQSRSGRFAVAQRTNGRGSTAAARPSPSRL